MKTVGVICGSNLWKSEIVLGLERERVRTKWGEVEIARREGLALLQRHGFGAPLPPHKIDNRANIAGLAAAGAARIVSLCSSGSLTESLAVGDMVVAADVFCPWKRDTYFDEKAEFHLPVLSEEWSAEVERTARNIGGRIHGYAERITYIQTLGPTFETKAEIRFLMALNPAVVGLTAAQEVFLACESGIPVALVCAVDNLAHGIGGKLEMEELQRASREHAPWYEAFIREISK